MNTDSVYTVYSNLYQMQYTEIYDNCLEIHLVKTGWRWREEIKHLGGIAIIRK